MKTLLALFVCAGFCFAADQAPKPADTPAKVEAKTAPTLSTSALWRLNSKALSLRHAADATAEAKAASAAEAEVQAEYQKLSGVCQAAGFVLGTLTEGPAKDDVGCLPKPEPKPDTAKGK
jgi:hypothetical protein